MSTASNCDHRNAISFRSFRFPFHCPFCPISDNGSQLITTSNVHLKQMFWLYAKRDDELCGYTRSHSDRPLQTVNYSSLHSAIYSRRSFAEGVFCVAFVLCAINGGADIINFICSARLSSGSIGTHEVINTRTPAGAGRRLK